MTIEIRQLRYALMSADLRSFSGAASRLNVKQATLSRSVLQLEDRLGIKLFERTTRGAEPTEAGKVFLETARRIITDVENLQTTARAVSYGEQGRFAVGYCSSLMAGHLKAAFSDYLSRFPDVQFDGVEGDPDKLCSDLRAGTIDVAIAPLGSEEQPPSKPLHALIALEWRCRIRRGPAALARYDAVAVGKVLRGEISGLRQHSCRLAFRHAVTSLAYVHFADGGECPDRSSRAPPTLSARPVVG